MTLKNYCGVYEMIDSTRDVLLRICSSISWTSSSLSWRVSGRHLPNVINFHGATLPWYSESLCLPKLHILKRSKNFYCGITVQVLFEPKRHVLPLSALECSPLLISNIFSMKNLNSKSITIILWRSQVGKTYRICLLKI